MVIFLHTKLGTHICNSLVIFFFKWEAKTKFVVDFNVCYHLVKDLCLRIFTNLSPIQIKESISSVLASVLRKDSTTPLLKLEHRNIEPITSTKILAPFEILRRWKFSNPRTHYKTKLTANKIH